MIFPEHCKFIGAINKYLRKEYSPEDIIYFSSKYVLVFEAPDRCEVYEVRSEGEGTFLKKKKEAKKIAGINETLVYDRPVDLSNRANLIRIASRLCDDRVNTVVFRGIDQHLNFVHSPSTDGLTSIDVYDIAPPEPAWLEYNIKRLDDAGMFGELMLTFNYYTKNLKEFEDPDNTIIFPCYASGLKGLFLDSLDGEPQGDIKLIGCDTSKQVFEARFPNKKYEHVNICLLSTIRPERPFVLRCCQSEKLGLTSIRGIQGIAVHWGANPREIYEAVKALTEAIKNKN
ncbi:hypothetical protein CUJ83_11835 [Methanocella sp. CWC-04]|uniref:Uncharacterized protein n=1 Tax=Methanooceanicella nereidis TaxID=2052831 RepID=A0AAP2RE95_9EURY|nr:hypothetical protein [Methanocella sp. CWC-04]MCD1295688.1 hypothetical protein [Methanocella sp. CWC-04]